MDMLLDGGAEGWGLGTRAPFLYFYRVPLMVVTCGRPGIANTFSFFKRKSPGLKYSVRFEDWWLKNKLTIDGTLCTAVLFSRGVRAFSKTWKIWCSPAGYRDALFINGIIKRRVLARRYFVWFVHASLMKRLAKRESISRCSALDFYISEE